VIGPCPWANAEAACAAVDSTETMSGKVSLPAQAGEE
jgi:hypothetical protein